MNQGIKLCNI